MNFIPYDINKINFRTYKKTKNLELLQGFIDSGSVCVKVQNWKQKNAYIAAESFRRSIKRFKFNVAVVTREGEVYLINVNLV